MGRQTNGQSDQWVVGPMGRRTIERSPYDGYVKYEEAEVHRSAIMQDFRDNENFFLNGRLAAILDFITAKFVMGYPCVRHYILFYIHGSKNVIIYS